METESKKRDKQGKVGGIGYRSCRVLQKRDGYSYRQGDSISPALQQECLLPPHASKGRGNRRRRV